MENRPLFWQPSTVWKNNNKYWVHILVKIFWKNWEAGNSSDCFLSKKWSIFLFHFKLYKNPTFKVHYFCSLLWFLFLIGCVWLIEVFEAWKEISKVLFSHATEIHFDNVCVNCILSQIIWPVCGQTDLMAPNCDMRSNPSLCCLDMFSRKQHSKKFPLKSAIFIRYLCVKVWR